MLGIANQSELMRAADDVAAIANDPTACYMRAWFWKLGRVLSWRGLVRFGLSQTDNTVIAWKLEDGRSW